MDSNHKNPDLTNIVSPYNIFNDRFVIKKKLSQGSFGDVYAGEDTQKGAYNNQVVLKINKQQEMNDTESKLLELLNQKKYKNFPKLLYTGTFDNRPCIIQERFGLTLEFYEMINKKTFSFKTVN